MSADDKKPAGGRLELRERVAQLHFSQRPSGKRGPFQNSKAKQKSSRYPSIRASREQQISTGGEIGYIRYIRYIRDIRDIRYIRYTRHANISTGGEIGAVEQEQPNEKVEKTKLPKARAKGLAVP